MPEVRNLKEQLAIELHYLGNSFEDIARQADVPVETAREWFKERGKLYDSYNEYAKETDRKLKSQREKELAEKSENILTITTNVMRLFGKKIAQPNAENHITIADFATAWKIQRVMQGLPISVQTNQFNFDQKQMDEEAKKIRAILEAGKDDPSTEPELTQEQINEMVNL
jgi:hypothetical protein